MSENDERLLPCPFCGCRARLLGGRMSQETYSVWCENDRGKRHFLECGTMDADKAIAEWNMRDGKEAAF